MSAVTIVEVAPRDGFQSVREPIPTDTKVRIVEALAAAGLPRLEIGSFVSPKAVPQMADTAEVLKRARLPEGLRVHVLVPNRKGLELAKAFGPSFIINSSYIDKSLRKEAFKKGKTILVFEGGESMRLDDLAVDAVIEGTGRLLHYFGMIDAAVPAGESLVINESSWLRAKISGIFIPSVKLGDPVKKGQVLAKITDPYGQVKVHVKSTLKGFVVGLNNLPVVNAGDALVHIGRV